MAIPIPSDQTKQIGELEASLKAAISGVWKGSAGAADDLAAVLPSKVPRRRASSSPCGFLQLPPEVFHERS